MCTRSRRGVTILELLITLVALSGVVVVLLAVGLGGPCCRPGTVRVIKDSTQVRGIHQGMILWAQSNQDQYPLPSVLDQANDTIVPDGAEPASKDTTANVMSVLIYNGYIPTELCVSPAEANPAVRVMPGYQYLAPSAAVNPAHALWDPAFSADFTGGRQGHFSYAHSPPRGPRIDDAWTNTMSATRAVIGNRGPQIASVTKGQRPGVAATPLISPSLTYRIHGGPDTWEGHVCYNDNHTTLESDPAPQDSRYEDLLGTSWRDVLFFDERDDPAGTNNFLGIWTRSGPHQADWVGIWD
jgi:hypothetical protein